MSEKIELNDVFAKMTFDPETGKGTARLKFSDCTAYAEDDKGKSLGAVSGCIGGGVELHIDGDERCFFLSPHTLWNSFVRAVGREDLVMEKPDGKGKGKKEKGAVKAAKKATPKAKGR